MFNIVQYRLYVYSKDDIYYNEIKPNKPTGVSFYRYQSKRPRLHWFVIYSVNLSDNDDDLSENDVNVVYEELILPR